MPNLENLRKQAKQYLRWHSERYYPVAAVIREHLPRFRQISDQEILTAAFRLADAQELVARKEGFEGWQALKKGAYTAMTHTPPSTQPVLTSVAAHLYVRDIKTSIDFLTTRLGLPVERRIAINKIDGEVSRDNAHLALRWMEESFFAEDIRRREDLLSASITLATANEIKELFLSYQASGVSFRQPLKTEPWGARTFIVSDPDGNLILFAGPDTD
jgi:uncharacterized glyoxalase superfamily protein PhnB